VRGFRNEGGFGKSEREGTIPLRLVTLNLHNPVNATVNYVKKDQYLHIFSLLCYKLHPWNQQFRPNKTRRL